MIILPSYKNTERGTWYCAFYYTDWQGKRKKKKKEGFKTKRESQEWERKFLEQYASTPDITFDALLASYIASAKVSLKPTTFDVKQRIINKQITPFFTGMQLDKITRRTVNEWRTRLLSKGYQTSYVRTIQAQLSTIFNFAIENYNLPSNPAINTSKLRSTKSKKINFWTLEEFRTFAMTLKLPQHIMAFYMLFWTGMRVGEMLGLTWDDIDFSSNAITISKTSTRLKKQNVITTTKTEAGSRVVIMPQFLADMLTDYRKMSEYNGEHIFCLTRSALLLKIHTGAEKAGVKQIRLHDLRHSHASLLINSGFSPTDVADRLGHANPAVTLKIYSHFYQSRRGELAEKLSTLM